ncbi:CHAT domain-containing protein [Podospora aff. communis PSN243]|uniref:CHAT domain-containing protein n=1 Tax=Podospora aff. communis PSN243 TaxID=3040156 RepID=A0AAV9G6E7_9PEZI|nr:CHAT domain-containing protein [Podospora aff. communis PSN243]
MIAQIVRNERANIQSRWLGRYEISGDDRDRRQAIEWTKLATAMATSSRERTVLWSTLSKLSYGRYEKTDDRFSLEEAIRTARLAFDEAPDDLQDQCEALNQLASLLQIRSAWTGSLDDVLEARSAATKALTLLAPASPFRSTVILPYCYIMRLDYEHFGSRQSLDEAIDMAQKVRQMQDFSHAPRRMGLALLVTLGELLFARFQLTENEADLTSAIEAVTIASTSHGSDTSEQARSKVSLARYLGILARIRKDEVLLREAYKHTIQVMELAETNGLPAMDRGNALLHVGLVLVEQARAVCAIHHGETSDYALKLLERGAGMALRPLFELRSPTEVPEGLVTGYCEALRRFNRLRVHSESRLLSGPHAGASHSATPDDLTLDEALAELRKTEGFEQALGELNTDQILSLARDGPIVVVFASETVDQAFMIAITESRIIRARFPGVSYAEAKERLEKMQRQVCKGPPPLLHARNKAMRDMLSWLWDAIVRPILDALGITEINPETLPWVHWMGVGVMSFAPFHAAGNGADSAMARCISSYCISLHSLHYARSRPRPPYFNRRDDAKLVAIAMPESPEGYHPLSEAMTEAMITCVLIQKREALRSTGDDPADKDPINILHQPGEVTKDRVLQALSTYNIVHLVCHGVADPQNPANSHLILQDGRLSVAEIAKEYATNADLAYLSACSTARCETQLSLTENLHIAASLQLVGFRNVIGTLWEAWDWASLAVSARFYAALFWTGVDLEADGGNPEDSGPWNPRREVAASLHAAVTSLRAENENSPLLWASYVHYGG